MQRKSVCSATTVPRLVGYGEGDVAPRRTLVGRLTRQGLDHGISFHSRPRPGLLPEPVRAELSLVDD